MGLLSRMQLGGVYSHKVRIFDSKSSDRTDEDKEEQEAWLVGGANNVGCAIH